MVHAALSAALSLYYKLRIPYPPGACSPWQRSLLEAAVRVEKEATRTERSPASTSIPACVRSPPKTSAVPSGGLSTTVGAPAGAWPSASSLFSSPGSGGPPESAAQNLTQPSSEPDARLKPCPV